MTPGREWHRRPIHGAIYDLMTGNANYYSVHGWYMQLAHGILYECIRNTSRRDALVNAEAAMNPWSGIRTLHWALDCTLD
jgi:hypothetical protein